MQVQSLDEIVRVARGTYKVITAGGEISTAHSRPTTAKLKHELHCDGLDTVSLRSEKGAMTGVVMFVVDSGHLMRLPVNEIATRIYHRQCRPGATHQIVGDVALANNGDFA